MARVNALCWLDNVDESRVAVIELDEWLERLPAVARQIQEGEIEELHEAAAEGLLEDTGDAKTSIKPIRVHPEIYELRRTALTKKLRFYHGEPSKYPDVLVKLHRHIKSTDSDQQVQIDHAASRYLPPAA